MSSIKDLREQVDEMWSALWDRLIQVENVLDAAEAWDTRMFNPDRWDQTEKDLHDALVGYFRERALGGEP